MKVFENRGNAVNKVIREVTDVRKDIYFAFILDTSTSMIITSKIVREDGTIIHIANIDQLNLGVKAIFKTLLALQKINTMFKFQFQIIELNSVGNAMFSEFQPISEHVEEINFVAEGCTCIENSLNTLVKFINKKHMPGYNKALNVILMSDGMPTNVNGIELSTSEYEMVIDKFKDYLDKYDYARNVDLYSVGVGADCCVDMLKYFSGDDRFFFVEEGESLIDKLDFVTRQTLADRITITNKTGKPDAPDAPDEDDKIIIINSDDEDDENNADTGTDDTNSGNDDISDEDVDALIANLN